jgi:putative ABC transport system permease protein
VFAYNLQLAWRSLFDRRGLTLLMIAAIAIGLGILMTVRTMAHQARQLPAGAKSYTLHLVQLDGRSVDAEELDQWFEGDGVTYQDARLLLNSSTSAKQQTYLWKSQVIVSSENDDIQPKRSRTLVGLSNFFRVFDAPFLYGSSWSEDADNNAEPVAVISKRHNDYFFGGENSVGQRLMLGTSVVTIVGVLDDWELSRSYYDMSFDESRRDDVFVPDSLGRELNLRRTVQMGCPESQADRVADFVNSDIEGLLASECAWIVYWAELDSSVAIEDYADGLEQYIRSQQSVGRFPREKPTYFLTNVAEHMSLVGQFRGREAFLETMSNLFFAVCLINAIGILLAKYTSKTKEVSLRRALGATKATIMSQHLLEVAIIGLLGGCLGILLSYFGLIGMRNITVYSSDYTILVEEIAHAFRLDWAMIASAFGIAISSTVLVGLYPIWRVCNTNPAQQLKGQ